MARSKTAVFIQLLNMGEPPAADEEQKKIEIEVVEFFGKRFARRRRLPSGMRTLLRTS